MKQTKGTKKDDQLGMVCQDIGFLCHCIGFAEEGALKQQKKGLMQKLLTGKLRVNLPNGGA